MNSKVVNFHYTVYEISLIYDLIKMGERKREDDLIV